MNRQDIVDRYNDGDKDILKYFDNNKLAFLKYLKKKEYWDQLDFTIGPNNDYHDGTVVGLLKGLKSADYQFFLEKLLQQLNDVSFENGKFFLTTENFDDLSDLFCDRSIRYFISSIISGEYDYSQEIVNWDDIDVWSDVIEYLNKENLDYLCRKIFSELKDTKIEPETELLQSLSTQQGHPDHFNISSSSIEELLEDDETRQYLFDEYLYNIESDLKSLYNSASETKYYSESYERIWRELNRYFTNPKFESRQHTYQKNTSVEYLKVEISDFDGLIDLLFSESDTSPEYYGSLLTWMKDELPCLRLNSDFSAYPSIDDINETFGNYF